MQWGVWSRLRGALVVCSSATLLLVFAVPATAKTGYDISFPQCGKTYPRGQSFGIVGVDGGVANDANHCLRSELAWAKRSPGLKSPPQPAASFYINTADPGPGVSDWPNAGSDTYGACHGGWSQACAYRYGQRRASYSYRLAKRIDSKLAATAPWWLDIEVSNTWAMSSNSGYARNIAAIRGFISGLSSAGAVGPIGIYSNDGWWKAITGLTARTTASAFGASPPAWDGGATTRKQARKSCGSQAFTGVNPVLVQDIRPSFDVDLRCG